MFQKEEVTEPKKAKKGKKRFNKQKGKKKRK